MRPVALSHRLQTVARMVTVGNPVCDVGCDHGFVPIFLVQQGISPRVLAMDLREGPLRAAKEHVTAYGLEEQIETRLSDGLHNYGCGEADTLICAGMGGGLMMRILADDLKKTSSFRELVLQPQSEIEKFRRFLRENGCRIVDEEILEEEGKFYQIIRAEGFCGEAKRALDDGSKMRRADALSDSDSDDCVTKSDLCKLEDRYGPVLLRKKTSVFLSFLEREAAVYEEILSNLRERGLSEEKRSERYAQVEALLRDNVRARKR